MDSRGSGLKIENCYTFFKERRNFKGKREDRKGKPYNNKSYIIDVENPHMEKVDSYPFKC